MFTTNVMDIVEIADKRRSGKFRSYSRDTGCSRNFDRNYEIIQFRTKNCLQAFY